MGPGLPIRGYWRLRLYYYSEDNMTKKHILAGLIILVIGSLLMAGCSGAQNTPAASTVDANVIYTQAAQTVQAGIAQTDVANPTATFTATVQPTKTMDPVMAAGLTQTAQAVLQPGKTTVTATGAAGAGTGTTTKTPIATLKPVTQATATQAVVAQQPKSTGDKAELVSQDPGDGYSAGANDYITMTLVIKNTGTTTWSTGYTLVYYAGERMDSPADFNMPKDVPPGDTVSLVFALKAPSNAGNYQIIWSMRNADGTNFYPIYFKLNVH